ncbi:MAG: sporulation protein YtfJ [Ruminococcaceae bacterium]|nr:sporulation protein YtfJ [Oscillospiraceae bacterium]
MANPIEGLMSVAMENIKQMVDVNTIIGDPVTADDGTIIIPVSKVSFGFGAGGSEFNAKPEGKDNKNAMFGGGAGGGVSINPVAFMVVGKEQIRLLPVSSNMSTIDRVVDMIPDLLNRFNSFIKDLANKKDDEDEPAADGEGTSIVLDE